MLDFLNTYSTPIKIGCIVAGGMACFFFGYEKAENEYLLKIEAMKRANAEAIVVAQQKVEKEKQDEIENLKARLDGIVARSDERVRELERFLSTGGNCEAIAGQRDRLAKLCVRGEELLNRAVVYLGSCAK